MTIIDYWINNKFKIKIAILEMKKIFKKHKKEYFILVIHDLLKKYKIKNKFDWFISNNALNNNIMLKHLSQEI